MIKEKKIKIKIKVSYKTKEHYKNLGYVVNKSGDELTIPIEHLPSGSKYKITAICEVCNSEKIKPYREYIQSKNKFGYYTCYKCSSSKNKLTKKKKYGDENFNNRIKAENTCLEKYGVKNTFQSDEIKEKIKQTNLEKYGVEFYNQTEEMKNKSKTTCLEKYDVIHHMKNKKILKKQHDTNISTYGVKHILQNLYFKNKMSKSIKDTYKKKAFKIYKNLVEINNNELIIFCDKCNKKYKTYKSLYQNRKYLNMEQCTLCNPIDKQYSFQEKEVSDFIKKHNIYQEKAKNIISPYELDIYLPDLKLAFEFNGLYWHNELHKENNYHKMKSDLCEEKGIQLIHIWEDDWIFKQEIIKSIILNKLGKTENIIYARKTEVKEINNNKLIRKFLDENHIQGFVGSSVKLGLFYENELVSLMTFGKQRKFMNTKAKDGNFELLRFCNKLNNNVVGGASKLFKFFTRNYKFNEIITYADRSYSNGNLYKELGFEFIHKSEPNYYYIINKRKYHRFNFRKNKLISEGYNKNLTEHKIMLERKIYRIYNAGNYKFTYS